LGHSGIRIVTTCFQQTTSENKSRRGDFSGIAEYAEKSGLTSFKFVAFAVGSVTSTWSYRYQANGSPDNLATDGNYSLLSYAGVDSSFVAGDSVPCWISAAGQALPLVEKNTTGHTLFDGNTLYIPNGAVVVHPNPYQLVATSWLTPATGVVDLAYQFADVNSGGGDGITYFVQRNGTTLATAIVPNGASSGAQARVPRQAPSSFGPRPKAAEPSICGLKPAPQPSTEFMGACLNTGLSVRSRKPLAGRCGTPETLTARRPEQSA
jgi:hypothetical protein